MTKCHLKEARSADSCIQSTRVVCNCTLAVGRREIAPRANDYVSSVGRSSGGVEVAVAEDIPQQAIVRLAILAPQEQETNVVNLCVTGGR
jgi:hypothetical protein